MGRLWSPRGKRWVDRAHHRYAWLYVCGFVEPATGKTVWHVVPSASLVVRSRILENFARAVQAGADKHDVLVLDGAGWHTSRQLTVPDGITLVVLPPYPPKVQPAERLWALMAAPLVNRSFATLDNVWDIVEHRCAQLLSHQEHIRGLTHFHWWPAC